MEATTQMRSTVSYRVGTVAGFLFSFMVASVMLSLVLYIGGHLLLPFTARTGVGVMGIVASVSLVGYGVRRWLA